ncbi:MAG: DNA mismatch repair endonuclease MutL [Bacteroidales bacterium]|nr:DNA mismatch repair endonuclease MutL [Bacteroidales bacterium]
MADIIQLLPDSVANQIAAGEVIQRPASVVKELMENAIDAGASEIKVVVKDAGKTSIQVIDDGEGMSPTDARLAFERHSTSKIRQAEDLFSIRTMGFRGEALASVAAISHVELKTRRQDDEVGTRLRIEGSQVQEQEPAQTPAGSNFLVRNLFYNVPARRKFLKKNSTELNHIIREFKQIVLARANIAFSLSHNNGLLFKLAPEKFGKRIVGVFGDVIRESITPIESQTRIVTIRGYIGHPDKAKKRGGEQFFFVNNRYMKNPYLHKAIMDAYEKIIPQGSLPAYFINLEVPSESLDVNIHPTKTEVKFEDQQAIWQILHASVRETLGRNHMTPMLDFDQENNIGIPPLTRNKDVKPPTIEVDPHYNPFEQEDNRNRGGAPGAGTPPPASRSSSSGNAQKNPPFNWQDLYDDFENDSGQTTIRIASAATKQEEKREEPGKTFFQFKEKYIITPVKSGMMVIHQHRAHTRILFEYFLRMHRNRSRVVQKELYPEVVELNNSDYNLLKQLQGDLKKVGIDIQLMEDNAVRIDGIPAEAGGNSPRAMIESLLEAYAEDKDFGDDMKETLALSLARATAIDPGRVLEQQEMRELVDKLFASGSPNYTPEGNKIVAFIKTEDFDKLFK